MPFATDGGGTLHTTVVPLNAATATLVLPARTGGPNGGATPGHRKGLLLQNQSSINIYWSGDPGLTAGGGFLLAGNLSPPATFGDITIDGPIYAIAASGTPSLVVGEVY